MNGFEKYLQNVHAKEYFGTDDKMPGAFDEWLECLTIAEWISLGDEFKKAGEL